MKTPNTKRIGALLCAALQITVTPYAFAECYTGSDSSNPGGLPGVFGVLDGGTINLTADEQCNLRFFGSTQLGITNENLTKPNSTTDLSRRCQAYTATNDQNNPTLTNTEISASGSFVKKLTLDPYVSSSISVSQTATLTQNPSDPKLYSLGEGNYGTVSVPNNSMLTIGPGTVRIKKLAFGACNSNASNKIGLELIGGSTYFIDEISWQAGCDVTVSGTGTAKLNVLGIDSSNKTVGMAMSTGFNCINFGIKSETSSCNSIMNSGWQNKPAQTQYDFMANEDPKKLQINLYHGDLGIQSRTAIAAGIYIDEGKINWDNGTPTVLVGQAISKGFKFQNNTGSTFFAKASAMNEKYVTPAQNSSRYDDYSLAAAGVSSEVKVTGTGTDGKVFLAIQRDGTTDANGNNTAGVAGDLVVYGLDNKGAYVTAGAIYASSKIAKWADKYAKIYTDNANNLSLIGSEPKSTLDTYAKGLAANAVFARPWRTAPALVDSTGSAAIFATDDGVLYSVKADGTLNWGWMPSKIATMLKSKLPTDATPATAAAAAISDVIAKVHPWGQVRTIRDGNTLYITGTALGGALHFALKTNSDGSAVPSIGFLDAREDGKTSPGGEAYTSEDVANTWKPLFLQTSERKSWPFGGDAPVASATDVFDGKVAYIVDKTLVVRNIDGTGSITGGSNGNIDASSNLLYWGPGVLFVGTKSGKLLQLDESGGSAEITATDGSWGTLAGTPILGVQGAITNGGGKLLLAQTWTGVYAATWTTAGWKKPWYTKVNGSSSSTDPKVPPLSESTDTSEIMLTTLPAIAPFDSSINNNLTGAVLIPYTKGSISASKATCTNSDISAWSFGPLDGLTGVQTGNAKMGAIGSEQKTDRDLKVKTGPGEATGLSIIMFKVNGDSYVGMENTASGMGESYADKAQQNNTVPDRNLIPGGGASGDATWTKATPPRARLNWRELTNFY